MASGSLVRYQTYIVDWTECLFETFSNSIGEEARYELGSLIGEPLITPSTFEFDKQTGKARTGTIRVLEVCSCVRLCDHTCNDGGKHDHDHGITDTDTDNNNGNNNN